MKCAFRNNNFRIFKSDFKSYNNNYYFSIIILLTLVNYKLPIFAFFFSVRATTLNFFWFYFYALRRFLANFPDYTASSGQKLFQRVWKQVPKKAKKSQHLSKSESDKKEHIKLPIFVFFFFFFAQKFHTILVQKPGKSQANSFYGSW